MAKGYTMLVEIQEDRMGNLLGSPVSEKHQKDLEAEYGTYEGFAQEGMPLHYEIMEYLSDGAKSEISRGWPARVRFPIDAYWHWVEFHRTEDSHFKNPRGNPGLLESLEKMRERESWPWAFFGSDGKVYAEPPEHVSFRARRVPPDELESAQATARHEEEVYGRAERSHKGNPEDFSQQVAYPFYVVEKASGKVLGGWDYREDAQDDRDELVEDSGWKKSALSIMTQKGLLRKWGAIQWTSDRVWSREARQARLKGNPYRANT